MLGQEKGTCSGSDLYFQTPSDPARQFLYYMTSCGYYYTDYDYRIEREDYNSYLIFYIREGRLSVRSRERTMVAHAGQVGFLDCHAPHEYHTIGSTEFVWLHLDGANTAAFYEQVTAREGGFVFDLPAAREVCDRIFELVYAYRNDQPPSEPRLSHMLYGLLITLLDHTALSPAQASESCAPVQAAKAFIRAHYSEDIALADLAAAASMSQFHFSRLFKKECGYSPYEYLILTRINRAKHLLKTTQLPVKIIAQTVGYHSVTTFTNAFTSRVGLSPSLFRKYPI